MHSIIAARFSQSLAHACCASRPEHHCTHYQQQSPTIAALGMAANRRRHISVTYLSKSVPLPIFRTPRTVWSGRIRTHVIQHVWVTCDYVVCKMGFRSRNRGTRRLTLQREDVFCLATHMISRLPVPQSLAGLPFQNSLSNALCTT